jgi:hypothetical protein
MFDDREKRLVTSNEKIKKIMDELGPELMEYFDDIRKPRKLKKKSSDVSKFKVGDLVTVGCLYGTIIYGPYKLTSGVNNYEVEIEDGEIITVEDIGDNIVKYVQLEEHEDIDEDK